jgi:hypothetical protein
MSHEKVNASGAKEKRVNSRFLFPPALEARFQSQTQEPIVR